MKKIVLLSAVLILSFGYSIAQKYAFVDTEYILANIPSYKAAQDQLDKLSADWQREVEGMYSDIEQMYKNFQTEKVVLTEELKRKREQEIITKEKEAKKLQNKYFGQQGELYAKRQELIKPIQEEVYNAVKEIATEGNFAIIFDTASGPSILFSDPKYDKSDEILQKLGYKN